jgi:hypothetical protein
VVNRRRGYSLMELVIVFAAIALIGYLSTIAATRTLDRNTARGGEYAANQVVLAQQKFATQHGTFTGYPQDLGEFKEFVVVNGPSITPTEVSVSLGENGTAGIAARVDEDNCVMWRLTDLADAGGAERLSADNRVCDGREALPASEPEVDDLGMTRTSD